MDNITDVNKAFLNRFRIIKDINTRNPKARNKGLYRLVISESSLVAGYERIKSNKGAAYPSPDEESLDGFGKKRLEKLQGSLRDESWKPRPARRILNPKPGKNTLRPLGIQGPEEKIVQSAVLSVLEAIYEPIFSPMSFGFRPNMDCHAALKDIETKYDGLSFAIEGHIKGMYDNVNHHTLIGLISRKVSDSRFISLIWKLLRAGYMFQHEMYKPGLGTPQGSIVSPILANIYLHELDVFMADITTKRDQREIIRTPIAKEHRNRINRLSILANKAEGSERNKALKDLKRARFESVLCRTCVDPTNRVYYHRYADVFIIGIAGSKGFAVDIKDKSRGLLESIQLQLSPDKTKVTNIRKRKARFLGYDIYVDTAKKTTKAHPLGKPPFLRGSTGWVVRLEAPIPTIIKSLSLKGMCNPEGFPTPKRAWSTMPDYQIVDSYSATMAGILTYYSGACHRSKLQRIDYILRYSCAMTLATKHKSSLSKVFSKNGMGLRIAYGEEGERVVSLKLSPIFREKNRKWQVGRGLMTLTS